MAAHRDPVEDISGILSGPFESLLDDIQGGKTKTVPDSVQIRGRWVVFLLPRGSEQLQGGVSLESFGIPEVSWLKTTGGGGSVGRRKG